MDDDKPKLLSFPGGGCKSNEPSVGAANIPKAPPGSHLDTQGRRLYEWICQSLIDDGRTINAAGIQIVLLVHTFLSWSADSKLCAQEGRYGISDNGNRYELPHSYNERAARSELKRELPEACLTVMSQIEARLKESKIGAGGQADLFEDLLGHARNRPSASSG